MDPTRIVQTVLEQSRDEDLQLLSRVHQGGLRVEELTDQDCERLQSFISAVDQECRRQGFASWASAQHWSRIYTSIQSAQGEK